MSTAVDIAGETGEFFTPDNTVHTRPWWLPVEAAPIQPTLGQIDRMIDQVDGHGYDGKQSGRLTAHLNAWIARGCMSEVEALAVQEAVTGEDSRYSQYWIAEETVPGGGRVPEPRRVWTAMPMNTAYVVHQIINKRMPVKVLGDAPDRVLTQVVQHIERGHAAVLSDGIHARTAFRPQGVSSCIYLHDPKDGQTRSVMPMGELVRYQTDTMAIIV